MQVNPVAVVFIAIGPTLGYLIGGSLKAAIAGLAVTLTVSFLASLLR